MAPKFPLVLLLALLASTLPNSAAATSRELGREYEQVRKIAMRDPKVKAAFANAQRRLDAKIIEIDPSLAGYSRPRATTPPVAPPAPRRAAARRAHVVVKGDTLASIARNYGVSVADLRASNAITDERKLAVGQVVTMPARAKKNGIW